mgnify:CR=1 FL=1
MEVSRNGNSGPPAAADTPATSATPVPDEADRPVQILHGGPSARSFALFRALFREPESVIVSFCVLGYSFRT